MTVSAFTFKILFKTAQFKPHYEKLRRSTYLMPPPSAVAGIIGAILGVNARELKKFCRENSILTGAKLCNLEGYYVTLSRIFKFDRDTSGIKTLLHQYLHPKSKKEFHNALRRLQELMPIKESEELFRPLYKLAVAGSKDVIEECKSRLKDLKFEYEIFGGNDYHLVEDIKDIREAKLSKGKVGSGYCPLKFFESIKSPEYKMILNMKNTLNYSKGVSLPFISISVIGPVLEQFVFVYGTEIVANECIDIVDDKDDKIFVYDPVRYLVP